MIDATMASARTPGEDYSHIVDAARNRQGPAGTIIAFADSRYLDVLMNWLVALDRQGIENYVVVALDPGLHRFLEARGIPSVLTPLRGDLRDLWILRIRVFAALCAAGIDIVHSDVDAVWIRDPLGSELASPEFDLLISQGTIWPPDVHAQFGFVLCCGLFRLRSNSRTRVLLRELESHVLGTADDQVSLNRLIAARSPQWNIAPGDSYYTEGAGKRFLCSRSIMKGQGLDGLRIAILPHHLFPRVPVAPTETPFVLHLLSRKDAVSKLEEFAKAGCLWLRSDCATSPSTPRRSSASAGSSLEFRAARRSRDASQRDFISDPRPQSFGALARRRSGTEHGGRPGLDRQSQGKLREPGSDRHQ